MQKIWLIRTLRAFGISVLLILLALSLRAEADDIWQTNSSNEINSSNFLFFEVSQIDNLTSDCLRPYHDFPTYYFNKTDRHLYPNIVPEGSYDFIEFNSSLIAIAGVGIYGNGASSQLEPIYRLPYSSIGKASTVPNYWTQTEEMGKISIINISESGLLVIYFENRSIELAPGGNWNKLEQCIEIRIENFGYLDKNTNNITLKSRKHMETPTPTESKPNATPGFEFIYLILGLVTVSYLLKNYDK